MAAESYNTARAVRIESVPQKGIEVLVLFDRVDEWLMGHLMEYSEKQFQDVGKGALDLGELDSEEDKKAQEESAKQHEDLVKRVKDVLTDKVDEVRVPIV